MINMDFSTIFSIVGILILLYITKQSIRFVPQNQAWIVQKFGKYSRTLDAGLHFTVPVIEEIAYTRTLKEQAIDVPSQGAITKDNIALDVDGVLYIRVMDPYRASYGVDNYQFAVTQLAQTTMRSEVGRLNLDETFEEREKLNTNIVAAINEASEPWGVMVLRYEIKDIIPPKSVLGAMEQQMRAEREKRAAILESEGEKLSQINKAQGEKEAIVLKAQADRESVVLAAEAKKQAIILEAEAAREDEKLRAEGEANAILSIAQAQAEAIEVVGATASTESGQKAVQLQIATGAIEAKQAIAKESTIVLMDNDKSNTANSVAEALGVMAAMQKVGQE